MLSSAPSPRLVMSRVFFWWPCWTLQHACDLNLLVSGICNIWWTTQRMQPGSMKDFNSYLVTASLQKLGVEQSGKGPSGRLETACKQSQQARWTHLGCRHKAGC